MKIILVIFKGVGLLSIMFLLCSCLNHNACEIFYKHFDSTTDRTFVSLNSTTYNRASYQWDVIQISSDNLYGVEWGVFHDKIWFIDDQGIHYIDIKTGYKVTISNSNIYNTMFFLDDNIWFSHNYLWHYDQDIPEDKVPFARFDLITEQYFEYPTDAFTGINITVVEVFGMIKICAGNVFQVFYYDKINDQFIMIPEYGIGISHIAGNDNTFIAYSRYINECLFTSTALDELLFLTNANSLILIDADDNRLNYPLSYYLPDINVTKMKLIQDELFLLWGGEGEPFGISILNIQTNEWEHYIDIMRDEAFSIQHEYIDISGYAGHIWIKRNNTVFLPLLNSTPRILLEFSFMKREFELIYTAEKPFIDVTPYQYGYLITTINELIFIDLNKNIEIVLDNKEIKKVLEINDNAILAITKEGLFICVLSINSM